MVAPLRSALALVLVLTGPGLLALGAPAATSASTPTDPLASAPPGRAATPSEDPFYSYRGRTPLRDVPRGTVLKRR